MGHPALALVCRLALAAIFLYAGVPKVARPQLFLVAVRGYLLLPDAAVPIFTVVLPAVEVLAGALLLLGIWVRPSAAVIAGLTAMFLIAIGSAIARGIDIECGCFAGQTSRVGWSLILRDAAMLVALVPVLAARRHWLCLCPGSGGAGSSHKSALQTPQGGTE